MLALALAAVTAPRPPVDELRAALAELDHQLDDSTATFPRTGGLELESAMGSVSVGAPVVSVGEWTPPSPGQGVPHMERKLPVYRYTTDDFFKKFVWDLSDFQVTAHHRYNWGNEKDRGYGAIYASLEISTCKGELLHYDAFCKDVQTEPLAPQMGGDCEAACKEGPQIPGMDGVYQYPTLLGEDCRTKENVCFCSAKNLPYQLFQADIQFFTPAEGKGGILDLTDDGVLAQLKLTTPDLIRTGGDDKYKVTHAVGQWAFANWATDEYFDALLAPSARGSGTNIAIHTSLLPPATFMSLVQTHKDLVGEALVAILAEKVDAAAAFVSNVLVPGSRTPCDLAHKTHVVGEACVLPDRPEHGGLPGAERKCCLPSEPYTDCSSVQCNDKPDEPAPPVEPDKPV